MRELCTNAERVDEVRENEDICQYICGEWVLGGSITFVENVKKFSSF